MVHETRIRQLNDADVGRKGKYVLYWMHASQRTRFNYGLEHAIHLANELKLPPVVCMGIMDDYPQANLRHYAFLMQGLGDVAANLEKRGIRFVTRHGHPQAVAVELAKDAAVVVVDRGYTRHQRAWFDHVADTSPVRVDQVEGDVVVPVDVVSDKHEYAARTIRPKINRYLDEYLVPLRATNVSRDSLAMRLASDIDVTNVDAALRKLTKLDRSVKPTDRFTGGEEAALKRLRAFVRTQLNGYARGRNEPAAGQTSTMSPYLHFGQISPVQIALAVRDADVSKVDRDAYLEELIVRRELSMNFCEFNGQYDSYKCIPEWARKTLSEHRHDERPVTYTRKQLERAETADPYWNAAQLEMTKTGFMHNYMRMYWGKKILEWTTDPQKAYELTLELNNAYELDGRDPNSFANIAWIYGLHDRPWGPQRKIFGLVRYMNAAGLERKFDMDAYVKWVATL